MKFKRTDKKVKDTRKILEEVDLNGTVIPLNLNTTDERILEQEREITAVGEALKQQHGGIENIPRDEILANDFVRIMVGKRYVLFKKIPEASGAVVIK